MRRMASIIFMFCLCCPVYSGDSEQLKIATLEYPPFIYNQNGKAQGPVVDIVKKIFKQLNVDITIGFYPIPRGLYMVSIGEVDAYFTLKRNEERERTMLFLNTPLIRQRFVMFSKIDSNISWTGDFQELRKYKIGVVRQTSYGQRFDTAIRNGELTNLEDIGDFELNFRKLLRGRIDLVINSLDVGLQILENLGSEKEVKVLDPPVEEVNSYLAFTRKKDYSKLAEDFDNILREMTELGLNDSYIRK